MNKLALIIRADEDGLHGIGKDIQHVKQFLMSPYGGSWNDSEFHTFYSCGESVEKIRTRLRSIKNDKFDYVIVVYSGHGRLGADGDLLIYLDRGVEVPAREFLALSVKQLSIFDCCRKTPQGLIKEASGEAINNFSGVSTRTLYENYIDRAAQQQNILYACSKEEKAIDTGHGALYLTSLLAEGCRFAQGIQMRTVPDVQNSVEQKFSERNFPMPDHRFPKYQTRFQLPFSINPLIM